jgi:hypothetical protein
MAISARHVPPHEKRIFVRLVQRLSGLYRVEAELVEGPADILGGDAAIVATEAFIAHHALKK